jgi:DNA-binding CsgD family transcriptional regulator
VQRVVAGKNRKEIAVDLGMTYYAVCGLLRRACIRAGTSCLAALLAKVAGAARPPLRSDVVSAPKRALTPAECDVAGLVVEGLTNRRIAEIRGTTENTVASQVASVLRKLGVSSRATLALVWPRDAVVDGARDRNDDRRDPG